MFDIGGPDLLVLVVAALFILGPERIPHAMRCFFRQPDHFQECGIAVDGEAGTIAQVRLKLPDNLPAMRLSVGTDFLPLVLDGQFLFVG